jgi:hypothetical protein
MQTENGYRRPSCVITVDHTVFLVLAAYVQQLRRVGKLLSSRQQSSWPHLAGIPVNISRNVREEDADT